MIPLGVFMLGPGGVGKTSLLKELDPGCMFLPFETVFDARDIITVNELMASEEVGPNYAMIEAFSRIISERDKIISAIKGSGCEIIYFDTPGQMEVFLFNRDTPLLLSELSFHVKPIGVFIMENEMVKDVTKLAVTELLSISFELYLAIPLVTAINKSDLGVPEDAGKMIGDSKYLLRKVETSKVGLEKDLILQLIPKLRSIRGPSRVVYTSSRSGEGVLDLFNIIHEAFCVCGDIT